MRTREMLHERKIVPDTDVCTGGEIRLVFMGDYWGLLDVVSDDTVTFGGYDLAKAAYDKIKDANDMAVAFNWSKPKPMPDVGELIRDGATIYYLTYTEPATGLQESKEFATKDALLAWCDQAPKGITISVTFALP